MNHEVKLSLKTEDTRTNSINAVWDKWKKHTDIKPLLILKPVVLMWYCVLHVLHGCFLVHSMFYTRSCNQVFVNQAAQLLPCFSRFLFETVRRLSLWRKRTTLSMSEYGFISSIACSWDTAVVLVCHTGFVTLKWHAQLYLQTNSYKL